MLQILRRKSKPKHSGHSLFSHTVIGTESNFTGKLQVEGELRIDGSFYGELEVSGLLEVSKGAHVDADIKAQSVSIAGSVNGTITAYKVEILASARVHANLSTNEFTSVEGCYFRGEVKLLQ